MGFATSKSLPRRTVLRGMGAALALPMLDAMVPAFGPGARAAGQPVHRFQAFYVPNGMAMQYWLPKTEGRGFELTPILEPLAAFREQMLVLSGLNSSWNYIHAGASGSFLTGTPRGGKTEVEILADVSMDQLLARHFAQETQLASLELALDSVEVLGACDAGYSCAYANTIAWRTPTTPLPMENNPRAVFERLFGASDSTDAATRAARMAQDRSILDFVTGEVAALRRTLGTGDRGKLGEYLEAVRDVERRIQTAERQSTRELPVVEQPMGIPDSFEAHARLMYDLLALAYQCDLTRVATFMIGKEVSGRAYPEIGVPDGHHACSHHQNDPAKLEKLAKINRYHMEQFAYFLDRLAATPDGDGSLLDHSMFVYGSGISDGNIHFHLDLPTVVVGGGAGTLHGGQHRRYANDTPLANLHVALLDKLGLPMEQFGDSTGKLDALTDL